MEIKDFCTGIQHVGIPTNNIKETIVFYEQLGFEIELLTQNGNETVCFLRMHNLVIETYENRAATMTSGAIDHIALDVKNIDSLFEAVKAKGLKMLDIHVNSLPFWENGVKFFTILGPNNEKVEFCERL